MNILGAAIMLAFAFLFYKNKKNYNNFKKQVHDGGMNLEETKKIETKAKTSLAMAYVSFAVVLFYVVSTLYIWFSG